MFERLDRAIGSLRQAVAAMSEQPLSGQDAVRLVEAFTEVERIGAAGRTLAARKVEESKIWQRDGHRTAAQWMAAKTGTSVGQAIGVLETARQLEELPLIRDAFCSGRLSETQAREVSGAAYADPRAERALLETARSNPLSALREECRKVRAAAVPDELAAYEAIRRRRYLRYWSEPDGDVRLDARLPPDTGAEVVAAVDLRRDRIFAEARRAGRRESSEAYAADALVELARDAENSSDGPSRGPRAMVHVLVDHDVYTTGRIEAGQRCEIPGIGSIPPATARALASDAIIKAVVTKDSDIHAVAHVGRTIPARVRTALEIRDPACVVPACDARKHLQIDHYKTAYADGGLSTLSNLARLCGWHHYLKTHCGYRLSGGPGTWLWERPDDPDGSKQTARPPPG